MFFFWLHYTWYLRQHQQAGTYPCIHIVLRVIGMTSADYSVQCRWTGSSNGNYCSLAWVRLCTMHDGLRTWCTQCCYLYYILTYSSHSVGRISLQPIALLVYLLCTTFNAVLDPMYGAIESITCQLAGCSWWKATSETFQHWQIPMSVMGMVRRCIHLCLCGTNVYTFASMQVDAWIT